MATKVKAKQTKSLLEAKTFEEVCGLERDNFDVGDFWVMYDGHEVTIGHKPQDRESVMMSVPIAVFRKLLKALNRQQKYKK